MRSIDGEIKYFVNKDKRTVVAKFASSYYHNDGADQNTWFNMFLTTLGKISRTASNRSHVYYDNNRYLGIGRDCFVREANRYLDQLDNFYGIAKCHSGDEFNEEIGKEIARKKLLTKYSKFERHMLGYASEKINDFYIEYSDSIMDRLELCNHKIKKNHVGSNY